MILREIAQCQSENQRIRWETFPPASKLSLDFQGLTHAAQAYRENFSPILRKFQLEGLSLLKAIWKDAVDFLPNVSQSLDYSSPIPLRSDYRLLHFYVYGGLTRTSQEHGCKSYGAWTFCDNSIPLSAILPGTPVFNCMVSLLQIWTLSNGNQKLDSRFIWKTSA